MKVLFPDDAREAAKRRYASQHRSWLAAGADWSFGVPLGSLTERDAAGDAALVRSWVDAWRRWTHGGVVSWSEVHWPKLGRQSLPARLELTSPLELAALAGDGARFALASRRHDECAERWPTLRGGAALARYFDVLADYPEVEYRRLVTLLAFLNESPASGASVRQLPVEGIDTKWIESKRRALVTDLLKAIRGESGSSQDFFEACGLRRPPHRVRMRILCPALRRAVGGLCDVEAPIDEIATAPLTPSRVLIVENLDTGLALPDIGGAVVFMKLGGAVSSLSRIAWMRGIRTIYWGDLDTHGLAILDRARATLGDVTSVLMDAATLLEHRRLWGEEPAQHVDAELPHLTTAERDVFDNLRANVWGPQVRLEQERIPWATGLAAVLAACGG